MEIRKNSSPSTEPWGTPQHLALISVSKPFFKNELKNACTPLHKIITLLRLRFTTFIIYDFICAFFLAKLSIHKVSNHSTHNYKSMPVTNKLIFVFTVGPYTLTRQYMNAINMFKDSTSAKAFLVSLKLNNNAGILNQFEQMVGLDQFREIIRGLSPPAFFNNEQYNFLLTLPIRIKNLKAVA